MAYALPERGKVVEPPHGSGCSRGVPQLPFRLIGEAVADTGNGEDKTRASGNRFDLLSQLGHVDVQAVRPSVGICTPYLFEQLVACENLAAIGDEGLEQAVLGGG